ncbi:hypothetical protein [Nonomuraea insulae]|uniref:Immunity protein Imm1 n=1 Tax=Nonomuraea insulae TaxID=1616787 RepID=A0ABW1DDK5_9ACTN
MAGFAMRTILGVTDVEVFFEEEGETWTFHWGSAGHVVTFFVPPGPREPGQLWYVVFQPSSRSAPVPHLLAIILSAVTALLTGGTLDDGDFPFERPKLDPEALLAQVLREAPLELETAIHLLRTGRLP